MKLETLNRWIHGDQSVDDVTGCTDPDLLVSLVDGCGRLLNILLQCCGESTPDAAAFWALIRKKYSTRGADLEKAEVDVLRHEIFSEADMLRLAKLLDLGSRSDLGWCSKSTRVIVVKASSLLSSKICLSLGLSTNNAALAHQITDLLLEKAAERLQESAPAQPQD